MDFSTIEDGENMVVLGLNLDLKINKDIFLPIFHNKKVFAFPIHKSQWAVKDTYLFYLVFLGFQKGWSKLVLPGSVEIGGTNWDFFMVISLWTGRAEKNLMVFLGVIFDKPKNNTPPKIVIILLYIVMMIITIVIIIIMITPIIMIQSM